MTPDFTVPLNGVEVGFRSFTSGQLIMMSRVLKQAHKQADKVGEEMAMIDMMVRLLDMIESSIIAESDREHVERSMLAGTVNLPEILAIMRQGKEPDTEADDDADPVDKPRANKTRTKKN